MNEDDSDWAASDGDAASDEEADGTFKPQYAYWAEKGTWKAKGTKGPRGRGAAVTPALNRHKARQQVSNASECHNCAVLGQAQRQPKPPHVQLCVLPCAVVGRCAECFVKQDCRHPA